MRSLAPAAPSRRAVSARGARVSSGQIDGAQSFGGIGAGLPCPAVRTSLRAFVLASAGEAGLTVRIEPITWDRFEAADEAFLTNAFGGAVPVRERGGAVLERVAGLFAGVWRY